MSEIRKAQFNHGIPNGMYYFHDSAGNVVDLILEEQGSLNTFEIKSALQFKRVTFPASGTGRNALFMTNVR